jgi:hypothetical protein
MGIAWEYLSWEYHGNSMGISWEIAWEYHGNIMGIALESHGNIVGISWKYIMGIYHENISWEYIMGKAWE